MQYLSIAIIILSISIVISSVIIYRAIIITFEKNIKLNSFSKNQNKNCITQTPINIQETKTHRQDISRTEDTSDFHAEMYKKTIDNLQPLEIIGKIKNSQEE